MKQIKSYIKDFNVNKKYTTIDYSNAIETQIDDLFSTLFGIYPSSKSLFTCDSIVTSKATWALALTAYCNKNNCIIDLKNGISNACRSKSPFFPTIGGFIEMCVSYASDDDCEKAYFDFTKNICRMDFLFIETKKACGYDARRLDLKSSKYLFIRTYKRIANENKIKINRIEYKKELVKYVGLKKTRIITLRNEKKRGFEVPIEVLKMFDLDK